jgi:hypothetical protein
MSMFFRSAEFFRSLQERMNRDSAPTEGLDSKDAYCGLMIGHHLLVLEFAGNECSSVVAGGNELDLDFVVAGTSAAWQKMIEAVDRDDAAIGIASLVDSGDFELRSVDAAGVKMANEVLPFLQVFLEQARGIDVSFE